MRPTVRAQELLGDTETILRQIERTFGREGAFEPLMTDRQFNVSLSSFAEALLVPGLIFKMADCAPMVSLEVQNLCRERIVDALDRDEIDFAISLGLNHHQAIRSRSLFCDSIVCTMRATHPIVGKPLTTELLAEQRQVKLLGASLEPRVADDAWTPASMKRDGAICVSSWPVVP